jgi:hypothetical protein
MKIHDVINEAASSVLYHATEFKSAEKIISSNLLVTKTGSISFTRSLTGSYHSNNKMIGVIFKIDGNKLNQKYKTKPVGTETWDDAEPFAGKENGQLEDRVFTDTGIKNFLSYVTLAIIYIPVEYLKSRTHNELDSNYAQDLSHLIPVTKALQSAGVPVKFVGSEKDLYNRKTTTLQDIISSNPKLFPDAVVSALGTKPKFSALVAKESPDGKREGIRITFSAKDYNTAEDSIYTHIEKLGNKDPEHEYTLISLDEA